MHGDLELACAGLVDLIGELDQVYRVEVGRRVGGGQVPLGLGLDGEGRGQRGGDGAQTAGKPSGAGGSGGAGSGGMVYLRSPNLEWGPEGSIDVAGGANNGGLVRREVDAEGPAPEPGTPLRVKGESTVCAPAPFTTVDAP